MRYCLIEIKKSKHFQPPMGQSHSSSEPTLKLKYYETICITTNTLKLKACILSISPPTLTLKGSL